VLSHVLWDEEAARDLCREHVVERLGAEDAVLVVDETGFLKKGRHSAGVARQYTGTAGRVENAQVGVFLAYGSRRGQRLIDRRLYLPERWAADAGRRRAAKVPEDVGFRTKPEIAREMVARALDAGVPCGWVLGDAVYGADRRLRVMLEGVASPTCSASAATTRSGRSSTAGSASTRRRLLARALPAQAWRRLSAGAGAKGERLYDWARVRLVRLQAPPWDHWLLVRRSVADPSDLAYFVVFGPAGRDCSTWPGWRGGAGWSRSASRPPSRRSGWPTTRCGAGAAGTGTSRSPCWRWPFLAGLRARLNAVKGGGEPPASSSCPSACPSSAA
jgi:SRSO17 transposase